MLMHMVLECFAITLFWCPSAFGLCRILKLLVYSFCVTQFCDLKLPTQRRRKSSSHHLISCFLCLHRSPGVLHLYPSPPFLHSSPSLQSLSSLVPVMHVKALKGKGRRRKSLQACLELEKTQGSRGGERKSRRPITPSEHLKLLAGLSSAAPLISPPISANPTGLPWTR